MVKLEVVRDVVQGLLDVIRRDSAGYSIEVPFEVLDVDPDPKARGVRPRPQKSRFPPNLSPPGVLWQGGCVTPFRNWDNKANKMLGAEF